MITIDLEENEDVISIPDKPEKSKEISKDLQFKRKLIVQVRRYRHLYDNKHKFFSNVAKKDLTWQQIATKLETDVDTCKETWFELRYNYQRHTKKLRNFFVQTKKENRCKRPVMALESELMFLWRLINNRKTCEIQFEIPGNESTQAETETATETESLAGTETIIINDNEKPPDDDLILVESPVELIVIDEDDDSGKPDKPFKLNFNMKKLITQVIAYPELYDSKHKDFRNYSRKSYLWNAIASKMSDKATKLMKSWIVMQTRYEWEICQTKQTPDKVAESELQVEFKFLKNFILENSFTVYKQSHFLKLGWHDPIDYFKDIYNLIVRMKKMPDIVYITDAFLQSPGKSKEYLTLWTDIANSKNITPGQCETTWLIMRYFYWELMNMRNESYQLTDKWYFESIITELYQISKAAQSSKKVDFQLVKLKQQNKTTTKRPAETNARSQGAPANKRASPITIPFSKSTETTPTIIKTYQNVTQPTKTTLTSQSNIQPQLTLPKITAAISLAPQSLNSGSLQIKQISGPPALSPAPFQLNNGTNTTGAPTTNAVTTQMSTMSFNLPSQTLVTPINMPALIRPAAQNNAQQIFRNTVPATISVRPQAQLLKPMQPQIQIASWATAPKSTINSTNVVTQIHNNLQPINRNSFSAGQIQPNLQSPTATLPTNNTPLLTQIPSNQQSSFNNAFSNQQPSLVPINSPKPMSTFYMTGLPTNTTISSSIEPLNNNNTNVINNTPAEINVAPKNTQLPKITGAISLLNPNEILIELIASQNGNLLVVHGPPLSAKYQLQMHTVAKFIREVLAIPMLHSKQSVKNTLINYYWDHISKTFNLPVHICRAIWNFLLENFDHFPRIAPMKDLMKPFQTTIKVWVESTEYFKKFDELCLSKNWIQYTKTFPDVVECISGYPVLYQDVAKNQKTDNDMEILCAWRTIGLSFPNSSNMQNIWSALKTCFVQYMNDLEIGIDNKWSVNWWRSLARMKFLVEAKYSTCDPYYYIISNKMVEEIDKFVSMEMRNRTKIAPGETETTNNVEMEIEASIISSSEKLKEVEFVTLLTAVQKYPIIYKKAGSLEKLEAWEKVAEELGMEVTCCLLAFKKAVEKYLTYKKRDPVNRFHMNGKYYKKFDEIVHSLPLNKLSSTIPTKINIKTPFELNQSVETVDNAVDFVFPERYISDINMTNCPSDLVVKNWIYAIGNISNFSESNNSKMVEILKKYMPNMK